jgi:hypothetical protein
LSVNSKLSPIDMNLRLEAELWPSRRPSSLNGERKKRKLPHTS